MLILSQNMADMERPASGPASAPVHLERKLSSAPLPNSREGSFSSNEPDPGNFSDNELEEMLIERVQKGDRLAKFQLGQFYFERKILDKAIVTFERIRSTDFQAKYQLGVMYYDGLGTKADHKKGVEYMKEIAESKNPDASHLVHNAQYNIGRAYFEGFGVKHSDKEAERWFLLAAEDGDPKGSVKAQMVLGMFYSRPGEDSFDLEKVKLAYIQHQEATSNGSIESQDDVQAIAAETDCLPNYVAKGIALGCFVYARCLHHGYGVDKDVKGSHPWYTRAASFDMDIAARLQDYMTYGYI
ncbi:hypothetical protein QZH41_014796 [Actinostola sp. cb2023]|nr:hypothetical protein QZH41_014796 [Actinostola sp. cb2023]